MSPVLHISSRSSSHFYFWSCIHWVVEGLSSLPTSVIENRHGTCASCTAGKHPWWDQVPWDVTVPIALLCASQPCWWRWSWLTVLCSPERAFRWKVTLVTDTDIVLLFTCRYINTFLSHTFCNAGAVTAGLYFLCNFIPVMWDRTRVPLNSAKGSYPRSAR